MKKLEVMIRADGAVVFVKPQKMRCIRGNTKALQYDLSMNTASDSVYFTCTFEISMPAAIDSVCFKWDDGENSRTLSLPSERIYTEPKGSYWEYRIRASFDGKDFDNMCISSKPPEVEINGYVFQIRESKWAECANVYKLGREIIDKNK